MAFHQRLINEYFRMNIKENMYVVLDIVPNQNFIVECVDDENWTVEVSIEGGDTIIYSMNRIEQWFILDEN